jgi:ArsR family transcriptional regulator
LLRVKLRLSVADMQVSAYLDESVAALFKAVADPTRVRILAVLDRAGELCVCHVEAALGLTQSRASRHLATLKRVGLVTDRRDGAWVHYSVPRRPVAPLRSVLDVVRKTLGEEEEIRQLAEKAASVRDDSNCGGSSR